MTTLAIVACCLSLVVISISVSVAIAFAYMPPARVSLSEAVEMTAKSQERFLRRERSSVSRMIREEANRGRSCVGVCFSEKGKADIVADMFRDDGFQVSSTEFQSYAPRTHRYKITIGWDIDDIIGEHRRLP